MTSFIHTKDLEQASKTARGQKKRPQKHQCEFVRVRSKCNSFFYYFFFFIRSWPQLLLLFYSYDVPTYVRPIVHELF